MSEASDPISSNLPVDQSPSMLESSDETPHHQLAIDPSGEGFWGKIENAIFHATDRLNPILVKESRESLKSRQFLITFLLLLGLTLFWTCIGIIFNSPDVYYVPTGSSLLAGYYLLLAIPIFGFVPLGAYRSLSSEIENDTFELLSVTELASLEIVRGKFASAVLQMMLYFAAVMPSLAFTYLLRGVSLLEISMILIAIMMSGLALTALALMMAPLMTGYLAQAFTMLVLVGAIVFVQFVIGAICLEGILYHGVAAGSEGWVFTLLTSMNAGVLIVIFLKTAAAQIAPVSENRSTSIRHWLVVFQATWIITIATVAFYYDDFEPINFGSFCLAVYWLVLGSIFLTESSEISPRVRRGLPATIASRAFLTAFVPGPSSGYLFAVCTGSVAILAIGLFGTLLQPQSVTTVPITYSFIMVSYLMCFLGLTRLVTLPLLSRGGVSLAVTLGVLVVLVVLASVTPSVFWVVFTGRLPSSYSDLEVIDPVWTSVRAFEDGLPFYVAIVPVIVGLGVTAVNLGLMRDLYKYRKVAVPSRVTEDLVLGAQVDTEAELSL